MNEVDNTQYSLLVNISKEIGELKGDIHNVESKISRTDSKIDEVFDALTKKQEFLRDSIEAELSIVRSDLKDAQNEIRRLKERVSAIEETPKNRIFELFSKFKGSLIAAIIALIVGYCMSVLNTFLAAVRN